MTESSNRSHVPVSTDREPVSNDEAQRLLAIYLNDHLAGSSVGLSLVRRCRRSNAGTPLDVVLSEIETELEADRRSLEALMERFDVRPSTLKQALGSLGELVTRVKTNGRIVRYSPLSRVVELEGLAAGIVTKRSLWTSLRAVADEHTALEAGELDALVARATSQYDRVMAEHDRAATIAFPGGRSVDGATADAPPAVVDRRSEAG